MNSKSFNPFEDDIAHIKDEEQNTFSKQINVLNDKVIANDGVDISLKKEENKDFISSSISFPLYFSSPITNTNNLTPTRKSYDFHTFYYDETFSKRSILQKQFLVQESQKIILNEPKDKIVLKQVAKNQSIEKKVKKQLDNKVLIQDLVPKTHYTYNNLDIKNIVILLKYNFISDALYSFGLCFIILGLIFYGLNTSSASYSFELQYIDTLSLIIAGCVCSFIGLVYFISTALFIYNKTKHFGSLLFKNSYSGWVFKQFVPFANLINNSYFLAYIYTFANTNSTFMLRSGVDYLSDL